MPARVVDASVLGALVFAEPRAEEAAALLLGFELYAPALLTYELASITRKKISLYPEQRGDLEQSLKVALAMDITWVEVDHMSVVRLAIGTGLTTYDASYLYVARRLGLSLVTFDTRLGVASDE